MGDPHDPRRPISKQIMASWPYCVFVAHFECISTCALFTVVHLMMLCFSSRVAHSLTWAS